MSGYAVVIPSKNISNLTACVTAIRKAGEDCPIIVIDDGVDWPWDEVPQEWGNVEAHMGTPPFVFARAVNEGIRIAAQMDVVIANDDALLRTPIGFATIRHQFHHHPEFGAICPSFTHGSVGTLNLVNKGRPSLAEEKVMREDLSRDTLLLTSANRHHANCLVAVRESIAGESKLPKVGSNTSRWCKTWCRLYRDFQLDAGGSCIRRKPPYRLPSH